MDSFPVPGVPAKTAPPSSHRHQTREDRGFADMLRASHGEAETSRRGDRAEHRDRDDGAPVRRPGHGRRHHAHDSRQAERTERSGRGERSGRPDRPADTTAAEEPAQQDMTTRPAENTGADDTGTENDTAGNTDDSAVQTASATETTTPTAAPATDPAQPPVEPAMTGDVPAIDAAATADVGSDAAAAADDTAAAMEETTVSTGTNDAGNHTDADTASRHGEHHGATRAVPAMPAVPSVAAATPASPAVPPDPARKGADEPGRATHAGAIPAAPGAPGTPATPATPAASALAHGQPDGGSGSEGTAPSNGDGNGESDATADTAGQTAGDPADADGTDGTDDGNAAMTRQAMTGRQPANAAPRSADQGMDGVAARASDATATPPSGQAHQPGSAGVGTPSTFAHELRAQTQGPIGGSDVAQRNAPPPAPVTDRVAVEIGRAVREGRDRMSIQLHPAELGRISVHLQLADNHRVVAVISADRHDTLHLLQRDSQMLERALQDAGLNTDSGSLSFNLRGGNGSHNPFADGGESGRPIVVSAPAATAAGEAATHLARAWHIGDSGVDISV